MTHSSVKYAGKRSAFTLIEVLVSTVVLVLITGILLVITQETGKVWHNTSGKAEVFRSSRDAFEQATRTLSQATLNTYYDYVYSINNNQYIFTNSVAQPAPPMAYARNSDLQIVSGQGVTLLPNIAPFTPVTHAAFFQAPLGITSQSTDSILNGLINACGYYVAYGPDASQPNFVNTPIRYRYRLMQFVQPSENLGIYNFNKGTPNWYLPFIQGDATAATPTSDFVLAENVIALIILPKLSQKDELQADSTYSLSAPMGTALAPNYSYDSSTIGQGGSLSSTTGASTYPILNSLNQLPPVIQVTMVAIDESSALKLGNTPTPPSTQLGLTNPTTLFTTTSNFQQDLDTLEADLSATPGNTAGNRIPLNFRVFQTDVAIRGAKWTTNE